MDARIMKRSIGIIFAIIVLCLVSLIVMNYLKALNTSDDGLIGKDTVVYWKDGIYQIDKGYEPNIGTCYTFYYDGKPIAEYVISYNEVDNIVYIRDLECYIVLNIDTDELLVYDSFDDVDEAYRVEFMATDDFTYLGKSE